MRGREHLGEEERGIARLDNALTWNVRIGVGSGNNLDEDLRQNPEKAVGSSNSTEVKGMHQ